jgi:hypothetical protein
MNQLLVLMGRVTSNRGGSRHPGDICAEIGMNKIQEICPRYFYGFCQYGPKCRLVHLKSVITDQQANLMDLANINIDKIISKKEKDDVSSGTAGSTSS